MEQAPHVIYVCTGNAARSVMAAAMTRARAPWVEVTSAGTHSIEGLPMSTRTRNALAEFGLADPSHRSLQLTVDHAATADLIVTFEPMHLRWIRKEVPGVADRTASFKRIARDLALPGEPLAARIAALDLSSHETEPWEEVIDPAGGELPEFLAAAQQIDALVDELILRLPSPK